MTQFIYMSILGLAFAFCPSSAFGYEVCNSQNNYLEDLLPTPSETISVSLPSGCVEASQRSLAAKGYYGFCPTDEGMPTRSHPRPCGSRKYVETVHSTLINVADCLDFDPRLAFATFNLESAMHLNAVGAATDVGVGQLTRAAIDEVTLNALDRARRHAEQSLRPSCQSILPFMTPHDSAKENRCGFMALPENPTRNLVYSILLIEQNRKSLDRYWTRLGIVLPPSVNVERLKERLTMLAYNAGSAGSVATLAAYIEQMGSSRLNERLLNFESRDYYSFVNYMANYYPVADGKESSRKRISKYINYIIQAARRVEVLARQRCFEPDTFPILDSKGPIVFEGPAPKFTGAPKRIERKLLDLVEFETSKPLRTAQECFKRKVMLKENFRGLNLKITRPCGG